MKYRETKGYKYLLEEDEHIEVLIPGIIDHKYIKLDEGELIVKKGYAWDGSSIPLKKILKLIGWDADKYCKTASLIHDALCQLMREALLSKKHKEYIDALYRKMCIAGGMGKRQANLRYKALRKAGNWGITKRANPRGQIKTA